MPPLPGILLGLSDPVSWKAHVNWLFNFGDGEHASARLHQAHGVLELIDAGKTESGLLSYPDPGQRLATATGVAG